jgi:hypothetical protein
MASFEQWLGAFQRACRSPKRASELSCPNCGVRALQLRFVTHRPDGWAYIAFWCDQCLEGIAPGRGTVPAAYSPVRDVDANIPNFCLVPPTE